MLAVAGIAAYISCWHACAVVRRYGENGVTALPGPGTVDGLACASSMVILHAARHRLPVPRPARAMPAPGITASLAVNVAQGWSCGLAGAAAAAWNPTARMNRLARLPGYADQDQPDQTARTRRTKQAGQSGKAPDHADQAG